ncbi:MAG: hypothetical protein M5U26_20980 [Planctomycetota bacterium]|nr:hypothetical protein [Planctomycetota bacterium]
MKKPAYIPRARQPGIGRRFWSMLAGGVGLIMVFGAAFLVFAGRASDPASPADGTGPGTAPQEATSAQTAGTFESAPLAGAPVIQDGGGTVSKRELPFELRYPVADPKQASLRADRLEEYFEGSDSGMKRLALDAFCELDAQAAGLLPDRIRRCSSIALPWYLEAAARLKALEAVDSMVSRFSREESILQAKLVRTLGALGGKTVRAFAQGLLEAKDARVRGAAWDAYALNANADDLDFLFQALTGKDAKARAASVDAFARLDADGKMSQMLRERFDRATQNLQNEALLPYATALSRMPNQADHALLSRCLFDRDPQLRRCAVLALAHSPRGVDRLVAVFQQEADPKILLICLEAFVNQPRLEIVPKVVDTLRSQDFAVSSHSNKLLYTSYGLNLGPFPDVWKSWLEAGQREKDPYRRSVFVAHQERRAKEAQQAEQHPELSMRD